MVSADLLPEGAQGLVFDCDGTLIDSMEQHYIAWKKAGEQFGLIMTPQLLVEQAGKPVHELFEIVAERSGKKGQVDMEEFFVVKREMYKKYHVPAKLIQPVMDIVHAARAKGLKMAVASGGTSWHVNDSLTETGIKDLFGAIVTGEDVSKGKPAPDGFLLAAEKIGVPSHLCVGYEDAKLGMEAIRAAGFMAAIDVTVLPGYPHFG